MKRYAVILALLLITVTQIHAQDTLRVVTYNLLGLADNASTLGRLPALKVVMDALKPDILIAVEVDSDAGCKLFIKQALDSLEFDHAPFTDGKDSDATLFYRKSLFSCEGVDIIPTALRNVYFYNMKYVPDPKAPVIHFGAVHLKAGDVDSTRETWAGEVTEIVNAIKANYEDGHVVLAGDFNFYTSAEVAYQMLLEDSLLFDPINTPGDWHEKVQFASVHTQCPRESMFGGGSGGGMDDRFDFILPSKPFADPLGWSFIKSSYIAFGNDGRHMNKAINDGENRAVSRPIANALYDASDHVPVTMQITWIDPSVVEQRVDLKPATLGLLRAHPNPFNSTVQLDFTVLKRGYSSLAIYSADGARVADIIAGNFEPGDYRFDWTANNMPSGTYIALLIADGTTRSVKLALTK